MFVKKLNNLRAIIWAQEQTIKDLKSTNTTLRAILVEVEGELHEAKHSSKHWRDKFQDLGEDYDRLNEKLKKRKKK